MSTFLEMQDRVLDGSKRDGLSNRVEVQSIINQVYLELHALLKLRIVSTVKTLTANVGDYSIVNDLLITDMQDLRHITIVDSVTAQAYVLEPAQPDYILLFRQTQSTAGGNMNYYALDGIDKLMFFPAPTSTTTQATISYVARPAVLVNGTDVPTNIPVEFHDVIVLGSISRAVRTMHPMYYQQYYAAYRGGINDIRKWQNRFMNSQPRKGVVKGSRAPGFPHDNSTYYTGMR